MAKLESPFIFKLGIVTGVIQEAPGIKTLKIRVREYGEAVPGQFNMIFSPGIGEVPISLSNLPRKYAEGVLLEHTLREAGAVTRSICRKASVGLALGIRGPYGRGWPLEECSGSDILIVAGGIGLAPLRPVIKYIEKNRESYGRLNILYGARTPNDMIYKYELSNFSKIPDTKLLLSVDKPYPGWTGYVGFVTELIKYSDVDTRRSCVMVCGPEIMMHVAAKKLIERGFSKDRIFLSLERRMRCGMGICGTCQFGHFFVCKDGPVFDLATIEDYLRVKGV
ncbi:MAG: FAD/NAD(P)-binding protein [Thermoprotei archaeon]